MALLTLTPSRFAAADAFPEGAYAYAMADRPVTKLGELVTPAPLVVQINDTTDRLTFDLVPNIEVDEGILFTYRISVFDGDGRLMYAASVIMPMTNSNVFDLIAVPQDLDACAPTTLQDNS